MNNTGSSFNKSKHIVDNFERAMREGWIEVYFQPIVRTSNGRVCAEEALVRWEDPLLGMLNPADFVPALEAVNQAHRLDLYVLEKTLKKMNDQRDRDLFLVPTAVNFCQVDFYSCDLVEEIASRVESAKISKHMIAIGISEGSLSIGNDYVISQIEQLQDIGFQIWMDDFGSGDSAPALLQILKFDLLKINIFFVKQITESESARIILTELIRMAMSLGIETVAEGVEFKEQVDFLQEIGCTKLQGFYYCKPIPIAKIFDRYVTGTAIGFENPAESEYYAAVGKVNLYDLSFTKNVDGHLENYFDTLPMVIMEVDNEGLTILRGNKTFKIFVDQNYNTKDVEQRYPYDYANEYIGVYTVNAIRKCGLNGKRVIIDDRIKSEKTVQMLIQRIAVNPVTKVSAVAIVILSVTEKKGLSDELTYNYIARALSEDYMNLYFVDLTTEDYVEYNPDGMNRDVSVGRRGTNFFKKVIKDAKKYLYIDDVEMFIDSFTKANIKKNIEKNGSYSITYRLMVKNVPTYVSLKAVSVRNNKNNIIIGVNNVDAQMKQREVIERIKEEQKTYSRIMALSGEFISIYTVDPKTNAYACFNSTKAYDALEIAITGDDFFKDSRRNAKDVIYKEDIKDFLKVFKKEFILEKIDESGLFIYKYRMNIGDGVVHVCLKAAIINENDGPKLLIGIIDIENQVEQEMEYMSTLMAAEDKATKDQLTGVKNKRAYADEEEYLNSFISAGSTPAFALVVCDLNGLKQVNDTLGHKAGDEYIKEGCHIICEAFSKSPVYRIGGDEFVAVVQGADYECIDTRIERIQRANRRNKKAGKVTIAVGVSKYEGDKFVSDVFERADKAMYANKKMMKEGDLFMIDKTLTMR